MVMILIQKRISYMIYIWNINESYKLIEEVYYEKRRKSDKDIKFCADLTSVVDEQFKGN